MEGIAIIGMSGRFPKAPGIPDFWANLVAGRDCIDRFSREELAGAGIPDAMLSRGDYVRAASILEGVEGFDAPFFGISSREAELMDPQHRVLLECAWEALEDAGYSDENVTGITGVYAGCGTSTYLAGELAAPRDGSLDATLALIGNSPDSIATRISHRLNLRGPSICVQTYCSTSLVAVHLACQSLLSYQTDICLAGASNICLPQKAGYFVRDGGITSPDGRCRPFDREANGVLFGNGAGMVVLKRLDEALADGDVIHAVIKGSAVNNDGSMKAGFTAPSAEGQSAVIAAALAAAGTPADTIGYLEAHGTGTPIGDPIEIEGLTRAFRASTSRTAFCALGSVKSNIGHLDRAAGIAGLIKAVLAVRQGQIPPSLHFHTPNPAIDFAGSPFFVNTRLTPWPPHPFPRRAGVSSFGIGGTNAHLIVEQPPEPVAPVRSAPEEKASVPHLLLLSARTPAALAAAQDRLAAHLRQHPALALEDVAYTLQRARRAFPYRQALLCGSTAQALEALRIAPAPSRPAADHPPVALLLPDLPAALPALDSLPAFLRGAPFCRERLEECVRILRPLLGLDLSGLPQGSWEGQAWADGSRFEERACAHFALSYALARQWMDWGLQPQVLLGQGSGEYVAACLAGVFSLEDALRLAALRGGLMRERPGGGDLSQQAGERLGELVSGMRRGAPRLAWISGTTGREVGVSEAQAPGYWSSQGCGPDRLRQGVRALLEKGEHVWVEAGPGSALLAGMEAEAGRALRQVRSLAEARDGAEAQAAPAAWALGQAWREGADAAGRAWAGRGGRKVSLPAYPFERKPYWITTPAAAAGTRSAAGDQGHGLIGRPLKTPLAAWLHEAEYFAENGNLVADHMVFGKVVIPGAMHLARLGQAALHLGFGHAEITNATFPKALTLDPGETATAMLVLEPATGGGKAFRISATRNAGALQAEWTLHAEGMFAQGAALRDAGGADADLRREEFFEARSRVLPALQGLGDFQQEMGLGLGPRFQWIRDIRADRDEALSIFRQAVPEDRADAFPLPPGLIDSCFQTLGACIARREREAEPSVYIPISVDTLRFAASGGSFYWCHAKVRGPAGNNGILTGDIDVWDREGGKLAEFRGVSLKRALPSHLGAERVPARYGVAWKPAAILGDPAIPLGETATWIVHAERPHSAEILAEAFRVQGQRAWPMAASAGRPFTLEQPRSLDPGLPEHWSRLLRAVAEVPAAKLLYWIGEESGSVHPDTGPEWETRLRKEYEGVLYLLQALGKHGTPAQQGPHVVFATQGAFATGLGEKRIAPLQAGIHALLATFRAEHPGMRVSTLDLDPGRPFHAQVMELALLASRQAPGERHALRDAQAYAPCLEEIPKDGPAAPPMAFRSDASYLITGGTGGLGTALAAWMLESGAGRVHLVGRHASSAGKARWGDREDLALADLDVCDRAGMEGLLGSIAKSGKPLRGIFHLAGVLNDGILARKTWDTFAATLRPKVIGALQLDALTEGAGLDFTVYYSSVAAVLDAPGQCDYAAANAILDGLAAARCLRGKPTLSIGWGPWRDAGMAARMEVPEIGRTSRNGLEPISPQEGIVGLQALLATRRTGAVLLMNMAWERFAAAFPEAWSSSFFLPLRTAGKVASRETARSVHAPEGPNPGLPGAESLEAFLEGRLRAFLKIGDETIDRNAALVTLGMDSLVAIGFRNSLGKEIGATLPIEIFFEDGGLTALAARIGEVLKGSGSQGNEREEAWEQGTI